MARFRPLHYPVTALAYCLLILLSSGVSWAQTKKAAPPPAAGAPTLAFSLPLGCQRGVPQELILTGSKIAPAVQFWTGCAAKSQVIADEKLAAEGKLKVQIAVPADTPLGLYPSRVLTAGGLSNMRLFAVDDLPQVIDNEANHDKTKPQKISTPCVVAGRTDAELSDFYKFRAKAGERLSFEVLGRRLGSPIDPLLSISGGKHGHELAYDNDSPGCQGDPRLSYTFKEAGEYVVEVRDVLGRGGPDFAYRLRIGDFPLATTTVPMAAKGGSKVRVEFAGAHIDGVKPVDVDVPDAPVGSVVWVTPKAAGLAGWPVALVVSDVEEIVEKEPNQNAGQATRLPLPGGVTGRFTPGDEADVYAVAVKKGQKISIEGHTLEWGSPTLLYLSVKNAKTGAELAKSNPMLAPPADQHIEFTATDDGDVLIEVQHLLYQGGPAESYHLSVRPTAPSFEVILSTDKVEAAAGAIATLPFTVVRKNYNGPIDVRVLGDDSVVIKLQTAQTAGVLPIKLKEGAGMEARGIRIEARGVIDGKPVALLAHAKPLVSKALADLVYPGFDVPTQVAVAVKESAPFTLTARLDAAEAVPGTPANVIVTATRTNDFEGDIAINPPTNGPANVAAKATPTIAKGATEAKFPLDIGAPVAAGDYFLFLTGKAKAGKRDVVSDPALLHIVVVPAFELKADPATLNAAPGSKVKLTVKATRRPGVKGPIAVELKSLPATVTGGKGVIAAEQTSVELELAIAPGAAGQFEGQLIGTNAPYATIAGPNVALRIGKK